MITKHIQRRNENIIRYRERGMTLRALARMFKLSHTQIANICKAHDGEQGGRNGKDRTTLS